MAFKGDAAMLLWYDIVPEQLDAHDEWHTREHFPERVAIPGFKRAQRWTTAPGGPRNFVVYEVENVDVLTSDAYMERLNNPSAWTSSMMPHFRGMVRGLCQIVSARGSALGSIGVTVRFRPSAGQAERLHEWLVTALMPALQARQGVSSAHLFKSERVPEMTAEQRIRGLDEPVDWALFVSGYSESAMATAASDLLPEAFEQHGASKARTFTSSLYRLACITDSASTTV